MKKELGRGEPQLQEEMELESEWGEAGAGEGELQLLSYPLSVLSLVSVPVSLCVSVAPMGSGVGCSRCFVRCVPQPCVVVRARILACLCS